MACTEEQKIYARAYYHANKDRLRDKRKEYAKKTSAANVARVNAWREKNPEKKLQWNRENNYKYYKKEIQTAWIENNRDHIRARERERYRTQEKYKILNLTKAAERRRAICKWANKERVKSFYIQARYMTKTTGIAYVVDHIVPIKHRLVCGLHNEFNLRVITDHENSVKKNSFSLGD